MRDHDLLIDIIMFVVGISIIILASYLITGRV